MTRLCKCGCGGQVPDSYEADWLKNHNKRGTRYPTNQGERHHHWKGGKITHTNGYIMRRSVDHPRAKPNNGYVMEHILIMEEYLGRYLQGTEEIHHKNGKKFDNRLENLELFPSRAAHIAYHHKLRERAKQE